jgi:hypothetical protein
MLKPRLSVIRPLSICLWLGSIAALGVSGGFVGCQGPDTFLRNGGNNGSGGSSFGAGGSSPGSGGRAGSGGTSFGSGGSGTGGAATGGRTGSGGSSVGGMTGGGGMTGTGGARDAGADATTGAGGSGAGGAIVVFDGSADSEAGMAARGFCDSFCSPTANVVLFTVGTGFHSPQTITTDEWCFSTGSAVNGANCSNFTGRTLTVNGVAQPNCGTNFTPPAVNGGWCFQISAGTPTFAAIAVF